MRCNMAYHADHLIDRVICRMYGACLLSYPDAPNWQPRSLLLDNVTFLGFFAAAVMKVIISKSHMLNVECQCSIGQGVS